ncbi:hypothetical protein V3W47_05570 [Deinococcus sp. YIM 134068]|uniref:hypothetical protein n=1 Tax=Deinococcus lichenicola TaxID=3118910 RepID=UPI002F94A98F
MRTARFLLPLALALSTVGSAQSYPGFEYGPDRWPDLLRVSARVPEFAGFTQSSASGKLVTLPALTDPAQEKSLRAFLASDTYWRQVMVDKQVPPSGSLRLEYSVTELVKVAQAVKAVRPNATVRVNTALNRVVLNADVKYVRALARQIGAGDRLAAEYGERAPELKYDIQPRVVSKSGLKDLGGPSRVVPNLTVLVTNLLRRPVVFGVSCGGQLPVHVAYANGSFVREILNVACTQELASLLIQPGETLSFPSFPWQKLTDLKPGKYLWVYGKQTFPFTLKP